MSNLALVYDLCTNQNRLFFESGGFSGKDVSYREAVLDSHGHTAHENVHEVQHGSAFVHLSSSQDSQDKIDQYCARKLSALYPFGGGGH